MERKKLDRLLNYLPVIVATCDRYGWCGGKGVPISSRAVPEVREFFEILQAHIPLKEVPGLEDVMGDLDGGITLLWETEVDPRNVTYDSFYVNLKGNKIIEYKGNLESIGTEVWGEIALEAELHPDIIEHIRFFQRKQEEKKMETIDENRCADFEEPYKECVAKS